MLNDCPFCHHSRALLFKEKQETKSGGTKNIYRCEGCGLLYPRPRMDYDESIEYLSKQHTNQGSYQFGDPLRPLHKGGYIMQLLKKHTPLKGDALDIGAFDGRFCYILESLGFTSYGLEAQDNAAQYARQRGLKVFSGVFPYTIPEELFGMKFNLISVMETIYYFIDLKKSIFRINGMLEKDGYLLIKCHQGNSRYYDKNSCFRRYGDTVQGILKVSSLTHCLEKSEFKIIGIKGEDSLDLLPFGIGSIKNSFLKRVLTKIYNTAMLNYTLLGIDRADRFTVLAKKTKEMKSD